MSHASHWKYSIQDYVRLEEYSNVRHEFLDGRIYAMAGGTPEHGARAAAIIAALSVQLRGKPCRVHTSNVRIRVVATGLATYPDISVVLGRAAHDPEDRNALTNPVLLVEVLSPNTEEYDRGEKLEHYKQLPSLKEVLFVCHDQPRLELCRRSETGWSSSAAEEHEQVELISVGCVIQVDEVFDDPLESNRAPTI